MFLISVGLSPGLLPGQLIEIEPCVRMMRSLMSGGEIWKAYIRNGLWLGIRYAAKSRHRPLALIQAISLPERGLFCAKTLCDDIRDSSARPDNLINVDLGLNIDILRSHRGNPICVYELWSSRWSLTAFMWMGLR
jgi:hypothetical protein